MIEIKAPQFPESIADGEVAEWHARVGETVRRDDSLVDIETDKVVLEVVAPEDGILLAIHKKNGDTKCGFNQAKLNALISEARSTFFALWYMLGGWKILIFLFFTNTPC